MRGEGTDDTNHGATSGMERMGLLPESPEMQVIVLWWSLWEAWTERNKRGVEQVTTSGLTIDVQHELAGFQRIPSICVLLE